MFLCFLLIFTICIYLTCWYQTCCELFATFSCHGCIRCVWQTKQGSGSFGKAIAHVVQYGWSNQSLSCKFSRCQMEYCREKDTSYGRPVLQPPNTPTNKQPQYYHPTNILHAMHTKAFVPIIFSKQTQKYHPIHHVISTIKPKIRECNNTFIEYGLKPRWFHPQDYHYRLVTRVVVSWFLITLNFVDMFAINPNIIGVVFTCLSGVIPKCPINYPSETIYYLIIDCSKPLLTINSPINKHYQPYLTIINHHQPASIIKPLKITCMHACMHTYIHTYIDFSCVYQRVSAKWAAHDILNIPLLWINKNVQLSHH